MFPNLELTSAIILGIVLVVIGQSSRFAYNKGFEESSSNFKSKSWIPGILAIIIIIPPALFAISTGDFSFKESLFWILIFSPTHFVQYIAGINDKINDNRRKKEAANYKPSPNRDDLVKQNSFKDWSESNETIYNQK